MDVNYVISFQYCGLQRRVLITSIGSSHIGGWDFVRCDYRSFSKSKMDDVQVLSKNGVIEKKRYDELQIDTNEQLIYAYNVEQPKVNININGKCYTLTGTKDDIIQQLEKLL